MAQGRGREGDGELGAAEALQFGDGRGRRAVRDELADELAAPVPGGPVVGTVNLVGMLRAGPGS